MKKILLVEDDPLITEIYTTKLEECDFDVSAVADGESAFNILKKQKFDLVVLDIVLPELTGFEVLQRIRNHAFTKDLKVLVLSNLGQKSDIDRAKQLGVSSYLIKANFTPNEVVIEIRKLLTK